MPNLYKRSYGKLCTKLKESYRRTEDISELTTVRNQKGEDPLPPLGRLEADGHHTNTFSGLPSE